MNFTPIEAAARQEFEYYGSTLTTNTALKFTVAILAGVIAVQTVALMRNAKALANVKPLVIRINEAGRADAIAYNDFAYKPQAPELRYFLSQFVIGYYGRNHQTVREKYVNSLYFLDRAIFSQIDARDRRSQWLPKFLASSDDDINISIHNVVIEQLDSQPYRARVEFGKLFSTVSGAATKRENWVAEMQFRINPDVPNQQVEHNPLGIAITYFREDQAFTSDEEK